VNLDDFAGADPIFVDANVFTYFALGTMAYQASCTAFLSKVEQGQVQAVTSDFVLNEVMYAMLLGKGSEILASTRISLIKKHLMRDAALSAACYRVCRDFWDYLTVLQATGLQVVNVSGHEQELSIELGSRYLLLPTDALHLATCHHQGIRHLATADAHFEKIDLVQVWKPGQG
jgi:predicted nucleic acid-binding protein